MAKGSIDITIPSEVMRRIDDIIKNPRTPTIFRKRSRIILYCVENYLPEMEKEATGK